MNLFRNIKDNLMKHNLSLALYSVLIAILVWFVISTTQYPSVQKTIEHVKLVQDITGTTAADNGLSLISCSVEEVTIEILGSRTEIGNLNSDNLVAYIDANNVSSSGTKNLSIKVRGTDSNINFEVQSVYPSTASVVLDKYDTREYPIIPKIPNVSVMEGKAINLGELTCTPDTVLITGPSAQLDKISKCYAASNKTLNLDSSYNLSNDEIQLYSEDAALIDQSDLTFANSNFSIYIPVRTQKTVKLSVSVANAPGDFDKNFLDFKISPEYIVLATNNSQTEIPDTIDIGKILLSDLDINYSKTFTLSTILDNSEYINVSDVEAVTVKLNNENLAKTDLTIDQDRITMSNIPDSSYEYNIITQRMTISVVGPQEIINEITAEDIIADVNLLNADITVDQFNTNVNFSCPKYDNVWVTTSSKVSVRRTKTESTTSSSGDTATSTV
ncbi:MAG TPA: hypothetical protein DCG30_06525 [Ruminococcus sp.]|nr:hypothetical protein [Ruminococcus sp.]